VRGCISKHYAVQLLCPGSLPYKHKIVIAGNHELSFDDTFLQQDAVIEADFDVKAVRKYLHSKHLTKMKDILVDCTYLEDSETTVFGLRVYGSPWYDDKCISGVICCLLFCCYLLGLCIHKAAKW